jgi:phospholipid transport system substrate-binding protein
MTRIAFCFVCLFSTLVPGVAPLTVAWAQSGASASAVVESLHGALLQAMKGGSKLGFKGRRDLLDPVVRQAYDLTAMARVASGAGWQKMSEDERSQVAEAFAAWTVATYASQFKSFDGEVFRTKGETEAAKGRRSVETTLTPKGEEPVVLNYQLREADGQWRIIDVYLDGSVSQLAIRRNEFAGVLGKGGVTALVASMKAQAAELAKGG